MEDRIKLADWILGFVPAQAVSVAAELGIADFLAHEAMAAEQLAAATHAHPRTLFRFLRYLTSIGIFQADNKNRFSLTPIASLLRSDVEDSMRSMARIMGRVGPRSTDHMIDGVRAAKYPFEIEARPL
jgi:C-methyltransferase